MLEINFINDTKISILKYQKLAYQLINNALKILGFQNNLITLTIAFIEDQKALELNKKYRNKDYVPDVLSFPTNINSKEIAVLGFNEIGDIIISLPEAMRKANKYHHNLDLEVAFLLVHGFLHLWGFDHEESLEQEKLMFKYQDKILETANFHYVVHED